MKFLPLMVTFIVIGSQALAGDFESKSLPAYTVVQKGTDRTLKANEAVFEFVFQENGSQKVTAPIKFSYNGNETTTTGSRNGEYLLKVRPGKYRFQFFYNNKYLEVYTDSISLEARNRAEIKVNFERSDVMIICDKPVIYLYPEKTTEVRIQLAIKGHFLFTYPAYGNGWNVTAEPNGTLHQENKTYNYLFWEGQTTLSHQTDLGTGFIRSTGELTAFFEEKLSRLGLNSKEMQDFITYWVPRMQQYEQHFIRFLVNEEYDQYAKLHVTPQPDKFIRVFMLWKPLAPNEEMAITEQPLPVLTRQGFTLVEWGGIQMNDTLTGLVKD